MLFEKSKLQTDGKISNKNLVGEYNNNKGCAPVPGTQFWSGRSLDVSEAHGVDVFLSINIDHLELMKLSSV